MVGVLERKFDGHGQSYITGNRKGAVADNVKVVVKGLPWRNGSEDE